MKVKHNNSDESDCDASGTEPAFRARHLDLSLPNIGRPSLVCDYASSSSSGFPTVSDPSNQQIQFNAEFLPREFALVLIIRNSGAPAKKRANSRIRRSTHAEPKNFKVVRFHSSTKPVALTKADPPPTTFAESKEHSIDNVTTEKSKEKVLNQQRHENDDIHESQASRRTIFGLSDDLSMQPDIHCDILDAANKSLSQAVNFPSEPSFSPSTRSDDRPMERLTLCLRSVPGLDIRPIVSAYELAAMVTLSPESHRRGLQRA